MISRIYQSRVLSSVFFFVLVGGSYYISQYLIANDPESYSPINQWAEVTLVWPIIYFIAATIVIIIMVTSMTGGLALPFVVLLFIKVVISFGIRQEISEHAKKVTFFYCLLTSTGCGALLALMNAHETIQFASNVVPLTWNNHGWRFFCPGLSFLIYIIHGKDD